MATLRIEHAIHDYDLWLKAFDSFEQARAKAGVRSFAVRQWVMVSFPSRVVFWQLHQADDGAFTMFESRVLPRDGGEAWSYAAPAELALRLTEVEAQGPNVVSARSNKASIRYEFGPDTLTWTLRNQGDKPLLLYMVLGPAVTAVTNGTDKTKTPTTQDWRVTTWFVGKARLTVTGGTKIWGPWGEAPGQAFQVWETSLAPKETRKVTLKVELLEIRD